MSDFTPLSELKRQLRKNLSQTIHERLIERGEVISKDGADEFIEEMRNNLDRATPALESQGMIEAIKNSFYSKKVKRKIDGKTIEGYNVHIPIDRNGLVMYLEYGTGLAGKNNKHPHKDFKKLDLSMFSPNIGKKQLVGWEYAVNYGESRVMWVRNEKYNKLTQMRVPYYTSMYEGGPEGFIFKKKPNSYIDANDVVFQNQYKTKYSWVKGYTIKSGKNAGKTVKPYTRYHKDARTYTSKSQYVFSEGLKSVHFIYDAKHSVFNKIKNK